MPPSGSAARTDDADARRAALRELCRPSFDAPQPRAVNVFGWIVTGLGFAGVLASLVFLASSFRAMLEHRPLAGEHLFAAGVGLAYALFFTRVWHGFRTLPDWRVARDVPLRVKVFASTGSALSASLAGGAAALLVFSICAKVTFLQLMERAGTADVGKVQVVFASLGAFFFCLPLWYLFEGMTELREWARTTLGIVLWVVVVSSAALGLASSVSRGFVVSEALGDVGSVLLCTGVFGVMVVWLIWLMLATRGEEAARHFRADEL